MFLPGDGKRKKPSFSRQSPCPKHTYGGFDKIKAAVPYAFDKGVTPMLTQIADIMRQLYLAWNSLVREIGQSKKIHLQGNWKVFEDKQ